MSNKYIHSCECKGYVSGMKWIHSCEGLAFSHGMRFTDYNGEWIVCPWCGCAFDKVPVFNKDD